MKELDWIKDLKVGDEVIVISGWNLTRHVERIEKVNKVTVRVNGTLFRHDGYERSSGWHPSRIIQCTAEAKEQILIDDEKRNLCDVLSRTNWKNMSIDRLRKIYAILLNKEDEE